MGRTGVRGIVAGLALAVLAAGCGATEGGGTGTFGLRVGDAPIDGAARVVVTFDRVELVGAPGRVTVWEGFETIDLLALRNCVLFDLVPPTSVPAGVYEQVRLRIVARADSRFVPTAVLPYPNFIDLGGGTVQPLRVPSGEQSGAKILGPFVVPDGGSLGVLADFDLRKSIHLVSAGASGQYLLRPVLRAVEDARAAAVRGTVTKAGGAAFTAAEAPVVYAWQGTGPLIDPTTRFVDPAKVVASAIPKPAGDDGEGQYCLGPLEPGTYRVTAVAGIGDAVLPDGTLVDQWDGQFTPQEAAAPVSVGTGQTAAGVDFSLAPEP